MNIYDLSPTFENIKATLKNDKIRRRGYLINFLKLLDSLTTNTTISLDGEWGSGKTFFVKQAIYCLLATNKYLNNYKPEDIPEITKKDFEELKGLLGPQVIKERTFIPVYYNAWKYDDSTEPVLSLINEITHSFVNSGKFLGDLKLKEGIVKIGKDIISSFKADILIPNKSSDGTVTKIGFDGEKLANIFDSFESMKKPNYLEQFEERDQIKNKINELIEKLCIEQGDKYVIFIDELDRCKPSFAVDFLERIKHYFSNDRLIFVFSTNINELQNTIKNYYGNNFNGCEYLDKFFDLRLQLPSVKPSEYLDFIGWNLTGNYIDENIKHVIIKYNMPMRNINHYLKVFEIAYNSFGNDAYFVSDAEQHGRSFCKNCFLPLLVYLQLFNKSKYISFMNGNEPGIFIEFVLSKREDYYLNEFISKSKNHVGGDNKDGTLRYVYNKIFTQNKSNTFYDDVFNGYMIFSNKKKNN